MIVTTCQSCGTPLGTDTADGLCPVCLLRGALEPAADAPPVPAHWELPRRFGSYELIEEIGRGGMGVVYRAFQPSLDRTVAVKLLLGGAYSSNTALQRFQLEAAAAAGLQHPQIVAIHDYGEWEGQPYYAMDLVAGRNLAEACDGRPLPARQAAEILRGLSGAVHYAHQRGILHRDLKPSNVLVDAAGRPCITDFGLAKRLDRADGVTVAGQMMGSPSYASPEQAAGRHEEIGVASDVYGLGALLYHLLTGRAPFNAATPTETLRLVLDTEPAPPRLLNPALPRDLETICLKCLAKEPARRYATAAEVAEDVDRFLGERPILARPPHLLYRIGKFTRRHYIGVAAVAALAVTLVAGTIVSTWQAVRATKAEYVAIQERGHAEDLLSFMLGDLRTQLTKLGRLEVLESVGDKALAYFATRKPGELDDSALSRHAKALTQIGEIRMAQARYPEATAAFTEAYNRAAALAARHPHNGELLFERGQAEYWTGYVYWRRGEFADATIWLTRYRDTGAALVMLDPSRATWRSELAHGQHNLAALRKECGELAAARTDFLAEQATLEQLRLLNPGDLELRFRIADAHSWLGSLADQQGEYAEAMSQHVAQTTQLEQLVKAAPGTGRWRFRLVNALLFRADVHMIRGEFAAAAERLKESRPLVDALVAHDPSNRRWSATSLAARLKEAMLARQEGNSSAAAHLVDEVRPALESLAAAAPSDRLFIMWLALAWRMEAQLRVVAGRADAATAAAQAVELGEQLIREGRATDADVGECARACGLAGEIAARAGDPVAAQRLWLRAAELLAPRLPGTRDWRLLDPAARVAFALGRSEEARATIAQLNLLGYVPLDPWPEADRPDTVRSLVPQPRSQ